MSGLLRVLLILWLLPAVGAAETRAPAAAIASAHPVATQAGNEILESGGNVFDAAVAVAAVLAVVQPYGSGLGGGGFWLLHRASDGREVVVDARERAPLAASEDMYLDPAGNPLPRMSLDGPLAAAIPGTPAALVHVAANYGRLALARSLAPAIRLARDGVPVTPRYLALAQRRTEALSASPASARTFLDDGFPPEPGFVLRQPELARTLALLAKQGHAGFYAGTVARQLVHGVRTAGGIWSLQDLARYQVVEREPLRGRFGGLRISTVPLPSSGGIVLLEALNILGHFDLEPMSPVERAHVIIEAMRLAYRDRARHLGDPEFVDVDVARLLSPEYAAELRERIDPHGERWRAPSREPDVPASEHTTHFSIIDAAGNRAAVTLTLNGAFGCGYTPPGTGVLLNNEMNDFSIKPGVPNLYGLVGWTANAIAPGKRPLSSMTPTFLEGPERVVVLGTPGGSRITSMVLLATLDAARGRGTAQDWVRRPRFHHQFLPDRVEYEPEAFTQDEVAALERRGHQMTPRAGGYGDMQAVVWHRGTGRLEAASDPRGEGSAQSNIEPVEPAAPARLRLSSRPREQTTRRPCPAAAVP